MNDCFAYKENGCGILTKTLCTCGSKCSFYKSNDQYTKERFENYKKLASMPKDKQITIADKYYGSMMPWNGRSSA